MVENNQISQSLTEDEAALYDRQIRLWGLDAQKRLRASQVLVCGICGLGAEVVKNLVLSGVKSLTVMSNELVDANNVTFLTPSEMIGSKVVDVALQNSQALNPMVELKAVHSSIDDCMDDFFKQFDVVCVFQSMRQHITRVSSLCHESNIFFYAGDVYGMHGYMFADLINHHYVEEVKEKKTGDDKKVEESTKMVKREEVFVNYSDSLEVNWTSLTARQIKSITPSYFIMLVLQEFLSAYKRWPCLESKTEDEQELLTIKSSLLDRFNIPQNKVHNQFVSEVFGQVVPVCAVIGGIIAQEVIKAVSKKDQPINNYFFFNPDDGAGIVEHMGY